MNGKGNSSHWIAEGTKAELDLGFMYQDKGTISDMLDQLKLPRPREFHFLQDQLKYCLIRALFRGDMTYFCRLIPQDKTAIRPYRPEVSSFAELREFCDRNISQGHTINLVESGDITHTGCIIVNAENTYPNGATIVELVHGPDSGAELFHGRVIPIQAEIDRWTGVIRHKKHNLSEEDRHIIYRAIHMIGGPKNPFPGYYEWFVRKRKKGKATLKEILFRNYQPPHGAYGKNE